MAGDYEGPTAPAASSIKALKKPVSNSFVKELPAVASSVEVEKTPEVQSVFYDKEVTTLSDTDTANTDFDVNVETDTNTDSDTNT